MICVTFSVENSRAEPLSNSEIIRRASEVLRNINWAPLQPTSFITPSVINSRPIVPLLSSQEIISGITSHRVLFINTSSGLTIFIIS